LGKKKIRIAINKARKAIRISEGNSSSIPPGNAIGKDKGRMKISKNKNFV